LLNRGSMRVYDNQFMLIDFFEDRNYFKVIRRGYDDEYSEERYKELMLEWREKIEFYKPEVQLIDYMNFYKPVPLYMQKWIGENLLAPAFKAGLSKVAFIISRDFYAQVSVEQIMLNDEGKKFIVRYFDNEAEGEKWLFE
jgi:hypothetical protein